MATLHDHRALITGASSGIGAAMARILAGRGCNLTLTARRGDRLEALALELRSAHGVDVRWVAADLGTPAGAKAVYDDVSGAGERIDILINNAGFGVYQAFAELEWNRQAEMIQLNVLSLVELCHRFLPSMLATGRRAYILNVSSIAAYQPVPYFACYAATKSYVRDFSEALAHELAGTNVSVTSVCPGGTWTEFMDTSGQKLSPLARSSMMSAERAARSGLEAMLRRRRNVVLGVMSSIMCFLMRLIPRRAAAWGSVVVLGLPAPRGASKPGGPDNHR